VRNGSRKEQDGLHPSIGEFAVVKDIERLEIPRGMEIRVSLS
jgi:hypothetical protein